MAQHGNDQYGDCTCAAAGHMLQNWTANAGAEVTPMDEAVLQLYEHFVGNPPPPDAGCTLLEVLKYWRSVGLGGRKILAFAPLEPKSHPQAQDAIYLFGAAYIGIELPDFAIHGDMPNVPWGVPPQGPIGDAAPNPNNGHCVPVVGYDQRNLYVVTWGQLKPMSWQFYDAYAVEAYAVLSQDFIEKSGINPAGFNLQALEDDLNVVGGVPDRFARYSRKQRPDVELRAL